jgi:hypothetical protein
MQFLKEPLVHFAIAGAILFAGYQWVNRDQVQTSGVEPLRIGEGEVRWLSETWSNQWLRPPTASELKGLIAEFVKEELLAREALEMGLDQGDTIVRRRLAQKLTFLVEDTTRLVEPTEEELRQFHATNAATFAMPATVTFTQVFFNATDRKDAASDARAALAKLTSEGNSKTGATLGDRLLIEGDLRDADETTVSGMFGPDFAREVFALTPGVWSGPIKSGYGVHLVLPADMSTAKPRPFEEARDEVLQEWRREQEEAAQRDYIARLREKYGVILDDGVAALLGSQSAKDVAVK